MNANDIRRWVDKEMVLMLESLSSKLKIVDLEYASAKQSDTARAKKEIQKRIDRLRKVSDAADKVST